MRGHPARPRDRQGFVELSALDDMLGEDVLAVSVMAVNNEIGTIQDIQKISGYACHHGAIFHCDAAQAPLAMPIVSLATHTDILSLSGHKMYGPKGVGVVFIACALQNRIEPLIYGGGQQNGLRSGTLPVPLCVGMGAAAELLTGENAKEKRGEVRRRRDAFRAPRIDSGLQVRIGQPCVRCRLQPVADDRQLHHPRKHCRHVHGMMRKRMNGAALPVGFAPGFAYPPLH